MERAFTTVDRPPARQLRWWQDVLSDVYYNVEVASAHREGLYGQIVEHDIGCASITLFEGDQQRVLRSRQRIAMDDEDSVALVMPTRGALYYSQSGRSGFQPAGSYVLVHTRGFYELACPDGFTNLTVKLPAARLRQSLPFFEDHCACAFSPDRRLAGVLQDYALWLVEQREVLTPALAARLSDQLLDLLVALLQSEGAAPEEAGDRAGLRQRIVDHLKAELCDPDLTPAKVARDFAISTSYLHRLFRGSGQSLGRWIAVNRLQRGYELLTLPERRSASVAEVAYAVGFTSQAHFSASFKRQFGVTPSAARARAARGLAPVTPPLR
ncbi:MAG: helix-turn-helix domain-containing protein [Rhodospirillales bacterium]